MEPAASGIQPTRSSLKKAPRKHSLEAYLRREERSRERHEYYDGYITPVAMAKGPHNEIAANTIAAIKNAVKQADKTFRVFSSNQKIYIPALNVGLYPDAVVVSEGPEYWDDGELLLTNPLLIVEVLSKSTRHFDRGDKFRDYKKVPSFMEYVMIEQTHCHVDTYFREEPDLWRTGVLNDLTAQLTLRSIGCSIELADVYEYIVFTH